MPQFVGDIADSTSPQSKDQLNADNKICSSVRGDDFRYDKPGSGGDDNNNVCEQ